MLRWYIYDFPWMVTDQVVATIPVLALAGLLGGVIIDAIVSLTLITITLAVFGCSLAMAISVRATRTTWCPRRTSSRANSAPMPEEAPVTTAVRSGAGAGRVMIRTLGVCATADHPWVLRRQAWTR